MRAHERLGVPALPFELLADASQVLARSVNSIILAGIESDVAISRSRSGDGWSHLHDHVPTDILQMRAVGELHVMDPAVDPVDHQIDALVHLVAGQPFCQDPACDLLVRPSTVADILVDPAVFFEAVGCERPMHGLDDIVAIGEFLQGRLGTIRDHPLPGLNLARQAITFQEFHPADHDPAVLAKCVGRPFPRPQVNHSPLVLLGREHLVEPRPPLRLNLRLQLGLKFELALVSEFQRHQFGSPMADAMGDIVSCDIQDTALLQDAADDDVGMRMAGVVMIDRNPVEACLQVLLHLPHKVAREASQVGHFVGIFRCHDKAELMPIFSTSLHKSLAISLVLNRRVGLPSLPVAIDTIPLEVAKMGIDRFARRLGPCSPCSWCFRPWGLSLTILALTATRRDRKRPLESCCQPPSCPSRRNKGTTFAPRPRALNRPLNRPTPGTGRFASDPVGITASSPDGHLNLLQERLGPRSPRGLIRVPGFLLVRAAHENRRFDLSP